jgi:carbon storage regulator CsrA
VLILSRYRDQIIDITTPDGKTTISLMVTDVDRGRVSIGVEAPKDWLILRRELKDRKPRERSDAKSKPAA